MYDYLKGSCKKGRVRLSSVASRNRSESVGGLVLVLCYQVSVLSHWLGEPPAVYPIKRLCGQVMFSKKVKYLDWSWKLLGPI